MAIYGGRTWEFSGFTFDGIYNNYAAALKALDTLAVGRYVLVRYTKKTLPLDITSEIDKAIESGTAVSYEGDKKTYYDNYITDQAAGLTESADMVVYRVVYDPKTEIISLEKFSKLKVDISEDYVDRRTPVYKKKTISLTKPEEGKKNSLSLSQNIAYVITTNSYAVTLNFSEDGPTDYDNEWCFTIIQGAAAGEVTIPTEISINWTLGIAPEFAANSVVEVRIVKRENGKYYGIWL